MESIWRTLRKNNVPKIVIAIIKAPFDVVATIENRRRWKDNAEWLEMAKIGELKIRQNWAWRSVRKLLASLLATLESLFSCLIPKKNVDTKSDKFGLQWPHFTDRCSSSSSHRNMAVMTIVTTISSHFSSPLLLCFPSPSLKTQFRIRFLPDTGCSEAARHDGQSSLGDNLSDCRFPLYFPDSLKNKLKVEFNEVALKVFTSHSWYSNITKIRTWATQVSSMPRSHFPYPWNVSNVTLS